VFGANSLEDLQNTKYFSKMSEKELQAWTAKRSALKAPYLPSEPLCVFDMGDKTEVILECTQHAPIKYIKFVPTGFRRLPINFTSKPFNSN